MPSRDEWNTLSSYLGGDSLSGGKLKETGSAHWKAPNLASNESGFTAFAGESISSNGSSAYPGVFGYWQTTTASGSGTAYQAILYYYSTILKYGAYRYQGGASVRCVRD